jgi:hypothetical protein
VTVVAVVMSAALAGCSNGNGPGTVTARGQGVPATTVPATTVPTTTAPTTTAPAPTPTGPVANPWPLIGPAPAGHHAILTMGDSLMGQASVTLQQVLSEHGFDAVVYDAHVNATGLLDHIDGVTMRELFARQVAAHPDVDTVMFEWLNACGTCGEQGIAYGSPEFYAQWDAMARGLVLDAYARGLRVVWALAPPAPPDTSGLAPAEDWMSFSERPVVAKQLETRYRRLHNDLGVSIADWAEALSDTDGAYQPSLWWDDALHQVRGDDRVHLTFDGSLRASTWTVAALAQLDARSAGSH